MKSQEAVQAHGFLQFWPADEIYQKYGLPNSRQRRTKVVHLDFPVEEILLLIRVDDPSNNRGRGWIRVGERQLADLLYIAIKVAGKSRLRLLADRNNVRADAAARALAELLSRRLRNYPVFGPERPGEVHSCGPEGIDGHPGPDHRAESPGRSRPG